ncbi:DUF1772 domain-containing protein [Wenzhouxiangella sp. XN79A]|uniref:anthrone oxygenase family protein n=1 Tax=Wenzhouxiangella sp. XN79A TaxID=2724193 RepID=UPI00144AE503|nr:anthrone oxygenase family protein [Wenzhouxiangella sp. XN79A]NKI34456.1 DUF1772 domain-containing protein [Wenzhouxiangella sp. XN79A]
MIAVLSFLLALSLLGGGLVVGAQLFLAGAVIQALHRHEPEQAMFLMRQINDRLAGPQSVALFIGTLLAVSAVGVIAFLALESVERWWLMAGAVVYLIGPVGVTMTHQAPLNAGLKAADWSNAERVWPAYRRRAQFWSVIRAALGIAALGALAIGAVEF